MAAATNSRLLLGTVSVLACHLIAVAALVFVLAILTPKCMAALGDFDLELPATTIMFINLANWLTDYWLVLVFLLVPDGFVYFGLSRLSPKWNWLATGWALGWLLAMIWLLVLLAVAMVLPLVALMTRLK
jgi:type II secretory pathway component PulF